MNNPYEILGVSGNADIDTIKKAYRAKCRLYHPDANLNNPNKEQAAEKFKELQEAYETIMEEIENDPLRGRNAYTKAGMEYGGEGQTYGYTSYNNPNINQYYNSQATKDPRIIAASKFFSTGDYREAFAVLDSIPLNERTGVWFFMRAQCELAVGNIVEARRDAQTACNLEPNNPNFEELYSELEKQAEWYKRRSKVHISCKMSIPMVIGCSACGTAFTMTMIYKNCMFH